MRASKLSCRRKSCYSMQRSPTLISFSLWRAFSLCPICVFFIVYISFKWHSDSVGSTVTSHLQYCEYDFHPQLCVCGVGLFSPFVWLFIRYAEQKHLGEVPSLNRPQFVNLCVLLNNPIQGVPCRIPCASSRFFETL